MLSPTVRISSHCILPARPSDGNQNTFVARYIGSAFILWKEYWNFPLRFLCPAHATWNEHKHYSCIYCGLGVGEWREVIPSDSTYSNYLYFYLHVSPHNPEFKSYILIFYSFEYWVVYDNKTYFLIFLTHFHTCDGDLWWEQKSFSLFLVFSSLPFPLVSCHCHRMAFDVAVSCFAERRKCTFTVRRVHPLEPDIVIWPHELARTGRVWWSLPAPWWLHLYVLQSWSLFRSGRLALLSFGQAPFPPSWTA